MKAPAVVVGLDCLQGLQTARLLAAEGIPVIGIVKDADYYTRRTNVCERIIVTNTSTAELVVTLRELGKELATKAVLFPCQDKNVVVVSGARDELEPWYHIVMPSHETIELLLDKSLFYRYAEANGLPIPKTIELHSRTQLEEAIPDLTFPCIVKPPLRLSAWSRHTKSKAFIAEDASELVATYDRIREWAESLLLQELIVGPDSNHFTCNCYFSKDGEPLATFVSQKLRQWEPGTGQATLSVEARNDVVVEETISLFSQLDFRGLGYLELKRDERTGRHLIIEPNVGRPTGRAAQAELGGVPLIHTMYCDALDLPLPSPREQQYLGVKWIHLVRDFQAAFSLWRSRQLTVRQWWVSLKGPKAYAVFSWQDPKPFSYSILRGLLLIGRKIRRGAGARDR